MIWLVLTLLLFWDQLSQGTLLQVHLSVGDGFVMEGLGIASFLVIVEFNVSFLDFDH
jgi:hypothetical protein